MINTSMWEIPGNFEEETNWSCIGIQQNMVTSITRLYDVSVFSYKLKKSHVEF